MICVIVAEPPAEQKDDEYLLGLLEADRVLLVLPKWVAAADFSNRHWAKQVYRLPSDECRRYLAASSRRMVRPRSCSARSIGGRNRFGGEASLAQPQLMTADGLMPIIDSNLGVLLGEAEDSYGRLWVLSDPDLISNQGLKHGDNAVIAVGMVQELLPAGGSVIVDEVIHGFRRDPSVWRALFEFPDHHHHDQCVGGGGRAAVVGDRPVRIADPQSSRRSRRARRPSSGMPRACCSSAATRSRSSGAISP